jgi:cytochrome c553
LPVTDQPVLVILPLNIPSVSGQKPEYNLKQLKDYASEVRKPQGQAATMRDIASNMTEEEMKAVTDYMYGLH